jgi:hypothetical protein
MKLTDQVPGRSGFVKELQQVAFGFDRSRDNFTFKTALFLLPGKSRPHDGKLLTAFSVKSRVDNDDDVGQHTSKSKTRSESLSVAAFDALRWVSDAEGLIHIARFAVVDR